MELELSERDGGWTLHTNIGALLPAAGQALVTTGTLGMAFEPEQPFENPDGTPITFDTDFFGRPAGERPVAGPFAAWVGEYRF